MRDIFSMLATIALPPAARPAPPHRFPDMIDASGTKTHGIQFATMVRK